MAHAKHKKPVAGVMGSSQIPYAQRLQMQRQEMIYQHREDAARTAMKVACVALNDTEGLGFVRLARFGARFNELITEFYEQPDVEAVHLDSRLRDLGFTVGEHGEVYALQAPDGSFRKMKDVDVNG